MGVLLIFFCTLIGYLLGAALIGFGVGLVIVLGPWALDEYDRSQRMRAIRRRNDRLRRR